MRWERGTLSHPGGGGVWWPPDFKTLQIWLLVCKH